MINEKGDTVACIRVESNIVFSHNFQSWIHRLVEKRDLDTKGLGDAVKTNKKVSSTILDSVYCMLIQSTDISESHYLHLSDTKRGMTAHEIQIRGYRSFPKKPWETVNDISKRTGYKKFPGVPGFYRNQYGWTIAGMEGVMIPYRNHYNQIVGFQIRVDHPRNDVEINTGKIEYLKARVVKQPGLVQAYVDGEMVWEKEMKVRQTENVISGKDTGTVKLVKGQRYFWLSSATKEDGTGAGDPAPVHVAVPTSQLDTWESSTLHTADSVWITEGALKADIAVEHIEKVYKSEELKDIGSTVVAIPGVNTWRIVMPVLEEMGVKHVNIAFDMDAMSNPYVEYYLKELAIELKNKGYTANLAIWNENDGVGIDDVLINRRIPQLRKLF
ncbi:DUF3854 domain-containing protein [Sporosarcina sp. FSL K6-1508]|uniref:DUF3854 domain-containing protein n=1 Tax=Sporosarcina sp. FSL K6-1508 TaxID=2921553 RepID=UPI0030F70333